MTKKIMFSDRFGLTQAVLEKRKTMTRRCPKGLSNPDITNVEVFQSVSGFPIISAAYKDGTIRDFFPKYRIGEVVAVAQCYKDIIDDKFFVNQCIANEEVASAKKYDAGWSNKMLVSSYYMPHRIRITNIKAERLQDISDGEIIMEGCFEDEGKYFIPTIATPFMTARDAFSTLIEKVSGRGTWVTNPYVFVYKFELVK